MSSPVTPHPTVFLTSRGRWAVTLGLLLGNFLAALEATVVSTAMPTVVASLGGLDQYSWVFSAYLLTSTASVPLWGRLSDLFGRRRIYLTAIALFLAGSMLAGVSRSMLQLVLFRALQGLGAGALIPLALTIIGEIYTLTERTRMQAVFSSVWGVASVAGPIIGGFITDSISWRWVFYLNLPIGVTAAAIIHRTLPEHASDHPPAIDWHGGILLFLSTTFLLVALTEASLVWSAAALGSIVTFAYVERAVEAPILPFGLFRNRTVRVATAIGFMAGMVLFGALAFIPLLIQVTSGGSATHAGQVLTPIYFMLVLASIAAARLFLRVGARLSTIAGTVAMFVACVALPWLAESSSRTAIFADMGLMGTGLGLALLSLVLAVQHSVPQSELGVATSLNLFARSIGGAVGIAIMGAILATGLRGSTLFSPGAFEGINLVDLDPNLRHKLVASLQGVFASGAVAAGLALVASFWVPPFDGAGTPSGVKTAIAGDITLQAD
jgi:EmrB/QacA subfamily drug resistance transporter